MGRISQTRRSLANLPQGGSGHNLDPADLQSPKPSRPQHHKRHSSRVDVISEKEELAAEDNSLSQQDSRERSDVESPTIEKSSVHLNRIQSKDNQQVNESNSASKNSINQGKSSDKSANKKISANESNSSKKKTKVCCPNKACTIF